MTELSPVELILAIVSVAISTLVTRAGLLVFGERLTLSHRVDTALRFAPACALTALIVPEVLYPAGVLELSMANPRLPATIIAAIFLLWRQSIIGAIVIGMIVYGLIRFAL
ncbi:MAG: AzlD domain-containing protein [Vicinamibacterales bacterium]